MIDNLKFWLTIFSTRVSDFINRYIKINNTYFKDTYSILYKYIHIVSYKELYYSINCPIIVTKNNIINP